MSQALLPNTATIAAAARELYWHDLVMKVGLSGGLLPFDVEAFDDDCCAAIAALGFNGLTLHLGAEGTARNPEAFDEGRCEAIRATAARHGLTIVQSWGFGANMCDPDDDARDRHIKRMEGALEVAARLGADGVITGAGTCDPRGGYVPHRDNHMAAIEDRLVASLSSLAHRAEDLGVTLALESHALTVLDSPERTRRVIDRVGSTSVRANLDPVNFVASITDYYTSESIVDRVLDSLTEVAAGGHVKDAQIGDEMVLRIDEAPLGTGGFAFSYFVERFLQALPDRFLFVEHLPAEQVVAAKCVLDVVIACRDPDVQRATP